MSTVLSCLCEIIVALTIVADASNTDEEVFESVL